MSRTNNIAFENLRAEMAREGIGIKEVAAAAGVNRDTMGRKLSRKSPLHLHEAFAIQEKYFPDEEVQYLFSELINSIKGSAS